MCLDENRGTLELRIHRDDVRAKALCLNHYSDADHASEIRRKSTGGAIAIIESSTGKSRAMLDAGCKTQPSVARSSGESETTALHELAIDLADETRPTPLQREVVDRTPERKKALANTVAIVAYPVDQLVAWLSKGRCEFNFGRLFVDAKCLRSSQYGGGKSFNDLSF